MREETFRWWQQAQGDLETARDNFQTRHYDACAFYSQQAAEKALKALHIHLLRQMPPKTHDLHRLVDALPFPPELQKPIRRLNPSYATARYPDAANGVPLEAFDEQIADHHLEDAQRVLQWVKAQLGPP